MGHSRAAASILVVSFKSSHEPLRTRTYHWIFMGSPGKLCIIGSDADSDVLRYSDWMLDHFLGTFSAAAPTTARMFSTASSVAKEVLATLPAWRWRAAAGVSPPPPPPPPRCL